jgi:hypothetical protein
MPNTILNQGNFLLEMYWKYLQVTVGLSVQEALRRCTSFLFLIKTFHSINSLADMLKTGR